MEDLLPSVLSGSQYDSVLFNGPSAGETEWFDEVSSLAHWFSLNKVSRSISNQPDTPSRISEAERMMNNALTLYRQLESRKISFDPQTGPNHILEWRDAIREFRSMVRI